MYEKFFFGWTIGSPALVLKAMAARTGNLAISFIADSSLCSLSLMSRVLWMKELRAPTMLHMMDIG